MNELDATARAHLDAYRASHQPTPDRRPHNWRAIRRKLEPPARSRAWSWGVPLAIAAGAVLALVALDRGRREVAPVSTTRPQQAPAQRVANPPQQATPRRPTAVSPPVSPTVVPPGPPGRQPALVPPAERQPKPATRPRARPPTSDLAAETKILDAALGALRAGQTQAALRHLGEHRRRFPAGAMVDEREAWTAIARCRAEPTNAAAILAAFDRARPGAAHRARVAAACKTE